MNFFDPIPIAYILIVSLTCCDPTGPIPCCSYTPSLPMCVVHGLCGSSRLFLSPLHPIPPTADSRKPPLRVGA